MVIPIPGSNPTPTPIAAVRSIQLEFPIVRYGPFRAIPKNQRSRPGMQLYGGVDIPTWVTVVAPAGLGPPTVRHHRCAGVGGAVEWRNYLASGTGGHS
jgi:hypothetical protein